MQIEWLDIAVEQYDNSLAFDKAIFVSANAVMGLQQFRIKQPNLFETWFAKTQFYAIGRATQNKGLELGFQIETLSNQQFDSEHFLAHEKMYSVQGQTIALVKGINGRTLLEGTLVNRDASVIPLEVYKREQSPFCKENWLAFLSSHNPVLLITSVESWQKLIAGIAVVVDGKTDHPYLSTHAVEAGLAQNDIWLQISGAVVMSQRIADVMQKAGWNRPVTIVETQTNQGIVEAIQMYLG